MFSSSCIRFHAYMNVVKTNPFALRIIFLVPHMVLLRLSQKIDGVKLINSWQQFQNVQGASLHFI